MIVECCYPDEVQDELLKDQYIFGLCMKEIQEHLLGELVNEHAPEKCLLELCKIQSKIKERKLLGIKTSMTYDAIYRGRNTLRNKCNHGRNRSSGNNKSCKYCGKMHSKRNCPAYGKTCQKCGRDNHFKSVCRSTDKCNSSRSRPKKGHKGKRFHEVNEEKNESMDDLADQVQPLFYHYVHFNSINMRMYTEIESKIPEGVKSKQTFKVDTGANGNLMPITMLAKLFQESVWVP